MEMWLNGVPLNGDDGWQVGHIDDLAGNPLPLRVKVTPNDVRLTPGDVAWLAENGIAD